MNAIKAVGVTVPLDLSAQPQSYILTLECGGLLFQVPISLEFFLAIFADGAPEGALAGEAGPPGGEPEGADEDGFFPDGG